MNYPSIWWEEFPQNLAEDWEILPQRASKQAGEVIVSKRNELGILSNFAETPFIFESKKYRSVEGFWQSLKYPEDNADPRFQLSIWPFLRSEVEQMIGREAKHAGDFASQIMKENNLDWVTYDKKKIFYYENNKGEFYKLIFNVMTAKLEQNDEVKTTLCKTKDLKLLPDHDQGSSVPPAWRYCEIWMEIRENLTTPT